jgi:hypothetical protein
MSTLNVNIAEFSEFVTKYQNKSVLTEFTEIASKNPYARRKIDYTSKCKCDNGDCIKYAMYHYVLEDKKLCWHHALCYTKN